MRFEEFAAGRLPAVLRFAGVLTGDRAVAEDVVQEVLIRASARWQEIGRLERPELYVRKMIVNEYLSWRRRSWRLLPNGTGADVDDRRTPDHALAHAERDALLTELGKLPRRQRHRADPPWRDTDRNGTDRSGTHRHSTNPNSYSERSLGACPRSADRP